MWHSIYKTIGWPPRPSTVVREKGSSSNRQNLKIRWKLFQATYLCLGRVTMTKYNFIFSNSGNIIPLKNLILDDFCLFSWSMPNFSKTYPSLWTVPSLFCIQNGSLVYKSYKNDNILVGTVHKNGSVIVKFDIFWEKSPKIPIFEDQLLNINCKDDEKYSI